jgi:hypothetical protein
MRVEFQIANVITTLLSAGVLWVVYRFFVVPTLIDHLRHRLFTIRREMFIFMAEGGIDSDHRAYGRVRWFLNSAIRYAGGLSFARSLLGAAFAGERGRERVFELNEAISELPNDTKAQIEKFRDRATTAVALYTIVRSPLAWVLAIVAVPFIVVVAIGSLVHWAWVKTFSKGALDIVRLKAEEEMQVLWCIEEDGEGAAVAA